MNEKSVSFESLRHHTAGNLEYWSARELAPMLEYRDWRNFDNVIGKAKQACLGSKHAIADHFVETTKMVLLGSGSQRELSDVQLSRYACYLIVQKVIRPKPSSLPGKRILRFRPGARNSKMIAPLRTLRMIKKTAVT